MRNAIYNLRRWSADLEFTGALKFVKLSDGRNVTTNDRREDNRDDGWTPVVPRGALIGVFFEIHVCQPKSKDAVFERNVFP